MIQCCSFKNIKYKHLRENFKFCSVAPWGIYHGLLLKSISVKAAAEKMLKEGSFTADKNLTLTSMLMKLNFHCSAEHTHVKTLPSSLSCLHLRWELLDQTWPLGQCRKRKRARRGRWSDEWCSLGRPRTSSSSDSPTNDSLPNSWRPRTPGNEGGVISSLREEGKGKTEKEEKEKHHKNS